MGLDEGAHPLPVIVRGAGGKLLHLAQVGAGAEGAVARTREHHHGHGVVPGGVLEGAAHLAQGLEVQGVVDLGAVDRDRGPAVLLVVDDLLESEVGGRPGREE